MQQINSDRETYVWFETTFQDFEMLKICETQWSEMGWSGIMEWNGVEWILVEDAFWSFWVILTLLVILGANLVVLRKKRKKMNFATRRRQIHPTN